MRTNKMSLRLLSCLLAMLLLLASCGKKPAQGDSTTEGGGEPQTPAAWVLAQEKKTDYRIGVNFADADDKQYAMSLQLKLYSMAGTTFPLVDTKGSLPEGKLILVGKNAAPESQAMAAKLGARDLACRVDGAGNLYLLATDTEMYTKLDVYLETEVLKAGENDLLTAEKDVDMLLLRDHPDGRFGSPAGILAGGKTEYVLIYDADGKTSRDAVNAVADHIKELTGVRFAVKSDRSENAKEIWVGTPDRAGIAEIKGNLKASGDYAIALRGDDLILAGNDELGLSYAVRRFAEMLKGAGSDWSFYPSEIIYSARESTPYQMNEPACVSLYREMYGTYGSYVDLRYATLSEADAKEQALTEALIDRMGEGLAFYVGSSTAIHRGFYVKTDRTDYQKKTKLSGTHLLVAAELLREVLDENIPVDAEGYADLTAWCEQNTAYRLELTSDNACAILTESNAAGFADPDAKVGGYTNAAYLAQLQKLFTDPVRRDPDNATEQTRVVIEENDYSSAEVRDYTKHSYITSYSPGICTQTEGGKEVLYASFESCYVENFATERENTTHLRRSTDGGKTWVNVGSVPGMRWASVFAHRGNVYLLGTHVVGSQAMVAKYDPAAESFAFENLKTVGGIGAPCSVLVANGRIFKANGDGIMSAPDDADLLRAESWTFSSNAASQFLKKDWFLQASGLENFSSLYALGEGSVVQGKDGKIYLILRIDCDPHYGYAAIAEVSPDGLQLSNVESCNSLIRIPTSISKFSVRYDSESGLYLAMTSLPTLSQNGAKQRNILALVASRDLFEWQVVDTLLVDREVMSPALSAAAHGFQYVDFVISGDRLCLIVREAVGETNSYHDGKYITYYTVEDFRALIRQKCPTLLEA